METMTQKSQDTNPLHQFIEKLNRPLKIFVVEDSDLYRELLKRFIQTIDRDFIFEENKNYVISQFKSGEECVKNLHQNPDIVVLDYYLNGYNNEPNAIDGMETLKRIKFLRPRTHVIIITSKGDMSLASQFIKNGASDYISKEPGVREKLQHSVARIMRIIRDGETDIDTALN